MLPGVHATTLTLVPSGAGMFAGTHGDGIFFSADGGKHWEQRDHGMSSKDVYSLAAVEHGDGITVYAGTQPASLFRSRDLGRSWGRIAVDAPGTQRKTLDLSRPAAFGTHQDDGI